MRQRGVAEAREQLRAVGGKIDSRRRGERRHDLLRHLPLDQRRELRIGRGLPDVVVSGKKAEIRKRGVAGVQKAQLHRLEGRDVGDELRAGVFPRRARRSEAVLDHPLPVRLGHDRRRVDRTPAVARPRRCPPSVVAGTMRSTIVDGNATCAAIHPASVGSRACANAATMPSTMRPLCGRLSQQTTVIAPELAASPRGEAGDDHAGRARRRVRMREVMHDVGMREVELSRRRIVAIALFRDGQR